MLTDGVPDADAGGGLKAGAAFGRFGSDWSAAAEVSSGRFMAAGSKGFTSGADGANFLPFDCRDANET